MTVEARLSSSIVRSYRKRDGRVSLWLRTHLIIETEVSFNVCGYLNQIQGSVELPGIGQQEFEEIGVVDWPICKYDGHLLVHEMMATSVIDLDELRACTGKVSFDLEFNFHGAAMPSSIRDIAVIRKCAKASPNKGFNRTPESSSVAKAGKLGGRAG